jgi:hypothetical protein
MLAREQLFKISPGNGTQDPPGFRGRVIRVLLVQAWCTVRCVIIESHLSNLDPASSVCAQELMDMDTVERI